MKYIKIAILSILSVALLSSCDKEGGPKGDGTGIVNFGKSSVTIKENGSMFTIPLKLTGEPGGYPVTVKITATGNATNINDVLLITSTTVKISKANDSFIQLKPVWNPESDENYDITLTIESVDGAAIGSVSTCAVRIESVIAVRYGQYDFTAGDGEPNDWTLILREGADGTYIMENMLDMADTPKMIGVYDEVAKTLTFNGRVNGKGETVFFNDIFWNKNGDRSFVFTGGTALDGSEPIVFTVNDARELESTQSIFQFWEYITKQTSDGIELVSSKRLGYFQSGALTYTGEAIPEEWPFDK